MVLEYSKHCPEGAQSGPRRIEKNDIVVFCVRVLSSAIALFLGRKTNDFDALETSRSPIRSGTSILIRVVDGRFYFVCVL